MFINLLVTSEISKTKQNYIRNALFRLWRKACYSEDFSDAHYFLRRSAKNSERP